MSTGTATTTSSFTHVITYFADKMLMLLGNIIRDSGLSMSHFSSERATLELGLKTWLQSGHLRTVTLEIFEPGTTALIRRWDLDWDKYETAAVVFWADIADIRYHMAKLGVITSDCPYRFLVDNRPGWPDLPYWTKSNYSHTTGLKQFSLGTTISAGGYGSRTSYWK